MRLLFVEDNDRLAQFVVKGLGDAGFTVGRVGSLEDPTAALVAARFDALVLDLELPDGDGEAWLKARRVAGETLATLMLTARASTGDKVRGLNAGVDDYLVKPFDMVELVARLKALLRRAGGAGTWQYIRFDTVNREARVGERVVVLSRSEVTLLELLLRRAGRVVVRRTLDEGLYRFDDNVGPNPLEAHISRLRKKLDRAGATVQIHSMRGVGYIA